MDISDEDMGKFSPGGKNESEESDEDHIKSSSGGRDEKEELEVPENLDSISSFLSQTAPSVPSSRPPKVGKYGICHNGMVEH